MTSASQTRHKKGEMEKIMKKKKGSRLPWQEKKELTDKEEILLQKDLDQLRNWIKMVESMDDEELKEYLRNRPQELKTTTIRVPKSNTRPTVQRVEDWASSYGIMASVWKFHKQDNAQLLP